MPLAGETQLGVGFRESDFFSRDHSLLAVSPRRGTSLTVLCSFPISYLAS